MGWKFVEIRISDHEILEMVVNITNVEHARLTLILRGRIRHSYMKQACPVPDANIYKFLPKNQNGWIRLL